MEEGIRGRTTLPECLFLIVELARFLHERARRAESADEGILDNVAADPVPLTSLEASDALQCGLTDTGELRSECIEAAPETDVLRRRGGCDISKRQHRDFLQLFRENRRTLTGGTQVSEPAAVGGEDHARAQARCCRQAGSFVARAKLVIPVAKSIQSDRLRPGDEGVCRGQDRIRDQ